MPLYTFSPIYQERIWGGHNLNKLFSRPTPSDKLIGEAWEVCDRPEAQSSIKETGQTLHELWNATDRKRLFGTKTPDVERFPILIKLLDAQDKLSLQVHPPAEKAAAMKGEPKTELWYFLDTTEDACIYVGLKPGVGRAEFEKAIGDGTVADCFHRLPTTPGETMFLPSGRVHAIGAGNVILEIQQNSDTTYRVYDWDRVDAKTGQPRDLHVQQSLECIDFNDVEPTFTQPHGDTVLRCRYFNIYRKQFFEKESGQLKIDPKSFQFLFTAQGNFKINGQEVPRGTSMIATADSGTLEIECLDEYGELVSATWPD